MADETPLVPRTKSGQALLNRIGGEVRQWPTTDEIADLIIKAEWEAWLQGIEASQYERAVLPEIDDPEVPSGGFMR